MYRSKYILVYLCLFFSTIKDVYSENRNNKNVKTWRTSTDGYFYYNTFSSTDSSIMTDGSGDYTTDHTHSRSSVTEKTSDPEDSPTGETKSTSDDEFPPTDESDYTSDDSNDNTTSTSTTIDPGNNELAIGLGVGLSLGAVIILLLVGFSVYYCRLKEIGPFKHKTSSQSNDNYMKQVLICQEIKYAYPRSFGERNIRKNLNKEVLPYDINRVRLGEGEDKDYINASVIDELFIAAQETKINCEFTFWRMIWEYKVEWIVLLTNNNSKSIDSGRLYHEEEDKSWVHGDPKFKTKYKTTTKAAKKLSTANGTDLLRTISLSEVPGNYEQEIKVFELNSWPRLDGDDETTALALVKNVQKEVGQISSERVVVVSGSGSGNAGVFIAIWKIIKAKEKNKQMMLIDVIKELREKREKMVTTDFHYKIIQDCMDVLSNSKEYSYP